MINFLDVFFFVSVIVSVLLIFIFLICAVKKWHKALSIDDEKIRRQKYQEILLISSLPIFVLFGIMLLQTIYNLVLAFLLSPGGSVL